MARGSFDVAPKPPVPRTVLPKVGDVRDVLGAGNQAVLATLKASPRSWNCNLSRIGKVLKSETSARAGLDKRIFGSTGVNVLRENVGCCIHAGFNPFPQLC